MIFITASTMKNLSLNSQNRLFSCLGIGLLIGFLVFHLIKISFVIPEACAIIYNTASLVNKFMKQRNKRIKKYCIRCCSCTYFFLFTYKDVLRNPTFVGQHLLLPRQSQIFQYFIFFRYRFVILLFHKFKYGWGSTKYYRTGLRFHETYFYGMKNKRPFEQPNPWTWK